MAAATGNGNPLEVLRKNTYHLSSALNKASLQALTVYCLKKGLISEFDANGLMGPGFEKAAKLLTTISVRNANDTDAAQKMQVFLNGLSTAVGQDAWVNKLKNKSWTEGAFSALDEERFDLAKAMMSTAIKPLVDYCQAEDLIGPFDPDAITTQSVETDYDKASKLFNAIYCKANGLPDERQQAMIDLILGLQVVGMTGWAKKLCQKAKTDLETAAGFEHLATRLQLEDPVAQMEIDMK